MEKKTEHEMETGVILGVIRIINPPVPQIMGSWTLVYRDCIRDLGLVTHDLGHWRPRVKVNNQPEVLINVRSKLLGIIGT